MIRDGDALRAQLARLHAIIRDSVVGQAERSAVESLAAVVRDDSAASDTIFALDSISEDLLVDFFEREVAPHWSLVLVAEGLPDSGEGEGLLTLPRGTPAGSAELRILIDPIDGTRMFMYQKRSAWILTGVAPNRGPDTSLNDIELALQTEIPLATQFLSDALWAQRGGGVHASRYNRLTGAHEPVVLRPSSATGIEQGFATICRFFPGMRSELAEIDEEIMEGIFGPAQPGRASCFEDQYICTGGQLYELIAGHDCFVADLRPVVEEMLVRRGRTLGITAHPYDLAAVLIAEEAGVVITDAAGLPLNAPLDVHSPVAWAGYANPAIQRLVEPHLRAALERRGLITPRP